MNELIYSHMPGAPKYEGWGGGGFNPPELAVDKLGGVEPPPLILREYLEKLITYVILYRLFL